MHITDIEKEIHHIESLLNSSVKKLDIKKKQLIEQEEKSQVISLSTKLIEHYLESVSSSVSGTLEDLMRSALQVFNMDITVSLEYREGVRGGYRTVVSQGEVSGGLDSFGGGVLSLVSFIMLVSTIVLKKKRRFIMLDESFSAVSVEYQEGLSNFVRQLCDDFNFDIALVSHQKSLNVEATRTYEVSTDNRKGTVIRKEN